MKVEKREFEGEFCQLSCAGQTRYRVDKTVGQSLIFITGKRTQTLINFHQSLNQFKVDESQSELAVKRKPELQL
jgi:hypothetical protein